jgi:hypothetical protein
MAEARNSRLKNRDTIRMIFILCAEGTLVTSLKDEFAFFALI